MPVKILICAVTLAALLISGCGEEKIIGTPDKAILAYAETIMTGTSEHLSAAGLSEEESNAIRHAVTRQIIDSMRDIIPLSDASAQELTQVYFGKFKGNSTLRATLKTNGETPVVELTTTPLDQGASAKVAGKTDEFIALLGMIGKLKSEGSTDEQLIANPEVQKLALTALGKYIEEIPLKPETTFEVKCKKIEGSDGKIHWAPADTEELIHFILGKK